MSSALDVSVPIKTNNKNINIFEIDVLSHLECLSTE